MNQSAQRLGQARFQGRCLWAEHDIALNDDYFKKRGRSMSKLSRTRPTSPSRSDLLLVEA
jgi:hypothetical protein